MHLLVNEEISWELSQEYISYC